MGTLVTLNVIELTAGFDSERVALLLAMAGNAESPESLIERAREVALEYRDQDKLRMWTVEQDGEIVGIAGIESRNDDIIVRDLAVMPEARGRGIGRGLLEFVRNELRLSSMRGYTWSGAVEFYRRCGFTVRQDGVLGDGRPRYAFEWRR